MKLLLKIVLTAIAVIGISYIFSGVEVAGLKAAIIVAIVLGVLNNVVAPILKFLTIPITIITLGFFLLVINAAMVMLADYIVGGFNVSSWLWALIFSLALSLAQCVLYKIFLPRKKQH